MANRLPLIAVVDDEESVRLALARMLRASSFEVSIYRCGEDFLESLKTTLPDCVVLDFQMPGLTGRDVQRALSLQKVPLPIIIVNNEHRGVAMHTRSGPSTNRLRKPMLALAALALITTIRCAILGHRRVTVVDQYRRGPRHIVIAMHPACDRCGTRLHHEPWHDVRQP